MRAHPRPFLDWSQWSQGKTLGIGFSKIGERITVFLALPEIVQFERRIAAETEHNSEIGRVFFELDLGR